MPAQPAISREYRIYLAIWRKAMIAGVDAIPVAIKTSSRNMAIAMRQGMYRAIRPFRNGTMSDEVLRNAAENFVVYLNDNVIELRPRQTLNELNSLFDEIGIDEEDLLLGEERDVLTKLHEMLEGTDVKPRVTPFYNRTGE